MYPNQRKCFDIAANWIALFNLHLKTEFKSSESEADLFLEHSFWRDALALTWSLDTMTGSRTIVELLSEKAVQVGLSDIALDKTASPPQWVIRAGTDAIEAFFKFETKSTIGRGILRLCPTTEPAEAGILDQQWRAWTLFTAIDQLKGCEEA